MTSFITIAIIGYALMAVVALLDKLIIAKSMHVTSYAFYSTIFFFGAFVFLPFSEPIAWSAFFWALASGLGFGFATWAMFLALQSGKATHVVPFIGASKGVFAYGLSFFILAEVVTPEQNAGIILLVLASLLFSYEKHRAHSSTFHPAFLWALTSGFLFSFSHVAAKYFYEDYSFLTGLIWTKGLVGVVAFFALFSAVARREIFGGGKAKADRETMIKNALWVVVANKVLGIASTVAVQYAIAIGSVAVVSGLVGVQYGLMLVMAAACTFFVPSFFKEYLTKKEMIIEITAILILALGVYFLV